MSRANKIEKNLSASQLQEFIQRLAEQSANPTLKSIQDLAAEYNITISHESARTFKRENFSDYIKSLENAQERASLIAQAIQGEEEGNVAAGAGLLLTERITEFLMTERDEDAPLKATEINSLAVAISTLRSSDQAERKTKLQIQKMQADLEKTKEALNREKAKNDKIVEKLGVKKETLEQIEMEIGLL